jgi:hypothetical protein
MNTISGSKDNNNNNNNNNSKTNNIFDFKKQKAEKTNYYNYINTEQNLFNHKSVGVANKNLLNINKIYSITEDDKNNGKNKKSSKDNNNNKIMY